MKSNTIRCFVAIEIPNRIQEILGEVQAQIRSKIGFASWTKIGNYHITLKFLGDVEDRNVDKIRSALEKVAKGNEPFPIEIGGIGAFPNFVRPRVLWVGLNRGALPTTSLANTINSELHKINFSKEDRFHPHFTLARLKRPINLKPFSRLFENYKIVDGTLHTVDKITLVRSELHPDGAVYTPLNKYSIGQEIVHNGK